MPTSLGVIVDPKKDTWILELTSDEQARCGRLCCEWLSKSSASIEARLFDASLSFHDLPIRIRRRILRLQRPGLEETGALVLRGLPQKEPPPQTPLDPQQSMAFRSSEFWLACVGGALGEIVGYIQEKRGALFQNIVPTRFNSLKLSSESSSRALNLHTEIAFHPYLPDYLLLYCIRSDPGKQATTEITSMRSVFNRIPGNDIEMLFGEYFRTSVDLSFGNAMEICGSGPLLSVLYGNRWDPFIRYDSEYMMSENDSASVSLAVLTDLLVREKQSVALDAGDLMIIDNRRVVHGRTPYVANYDGRDRWVQRAAVVKDLSPSAAHRELGGRVIRTEFGQHRCECSRDVRGRRI